MNVIRYGGLGLSHIYFKMELLGTPSSLRGRLDDRRTRTPRAPEERAALGMRVLRALYARHLLPCELEAGGERRKERRVLRLELHVSDHKRAHVLLLLRLCARLPRRAR